EREVVAEPRRADRDLAGHPQLGVIVGAAALIPLDLNGVGAVAGADQRRVVGAGLVEADRVGAQRRRQVERIVAGQRGRGVGARLSQLLGVAARQDHHLVALERRVGRRVVGPELAGVDVERLGVAGVLGGDLIFTRTVDAHRVPGIHRDVIARLVRWHRATTAVGVAVRDPGKIELGAAGRVRIAVAGITVTGITVTRIAVTGITFALALARITRRGKGADPIVDSGGESISVFLAAGHQQGQRARGQDNRSDR